MPIGAHRTSRARLTALRYGQPLKPDEALPSLLGKQGSTTCPECGAVVTLRQANTEYRDLANGIKHKDIVISNHAVGGSGLQGRNKVRCRGSGAKP